MRTQEGRRRLEQGSFLRSPVESVSHEKDWVIGGKISQHQPKNKYIFLHTIPTCCH
jgi:hypothetical protein